MKIDLNNLNQLFEKHYSIKQVEHKEDLFMSIIKEKDQEKYSLLAKLNESKKEIEILEKKFSKEEKINETLRSRMDYLENSFIFTKILLFFLAILVVLYIVISMYFTIKFKYYKLSEKIKRR